MWFEKLNNTLQGRVQLKLTECVRGNLIVKDFRPFESNIIVLDASLLIAQLVKDYNVDGLTFLAVGTGQTFWDKNNPPAATAAQNTLFTELTRKAFGSTTFIDGATPVAFRTDTVDFFTTFLAGEGTGALCEMGLWGGAGASVANSGTLFNYFTFPVINKGALQILDVTWRISF